MEGSKNQPEIAASHRARGAACGPLFGLTRIPGAICCLDNLWSVTEEFYVSDGVVAQLVERLVRNEKVRGSTPLGSTTQWNKGLLTIVLQ